MKIPVFDPVAKYAEVELTRRNLETLLAKLEHNRGVLGLNIDASPDTDRASLSACAIESSNGAGMIRVKAVEDEEHYADRDPGLMLDNATGEVY